MLMVTLLSPVGCTISVTCVFTNRSESEIAVTRIIHNERQLLGRIMKGETTDIKHVSSRAFIEIEGLSRILQYDIRNPPEECIVFDGWGPWTRRVFRAELRQDGQIWVFCPADTGPYPLAPPTCAGAIKFGGGMAWVN